MSTTILASDPSITYSPQNAWAPSGNGTMTTNNVGASAQLTFNGAFVQVFGTIPPISGNETTCPVSIYTLDHATSVVFNTSDFANIRLITNHIFYQSSLGLTSGNHSLVITAITTDNQADFILGTIVYSNVSVSTSVPSLSDSIPEPTPTSFPSSQTALSAVDTPAHAPVGAIVGGVIAALVVLVVAFMFYRLYRRRKMSILARAQDSVSDYPPSPGPFCLVCHQRPAPMEGRYGLESPSSLSTFPPR
ncbi:hypothetical protein BT96DRAFT_87831 [Gymnopus androsaceus JB14]|uniref:Mid2 domain-containing protein n=1 Tax=Gymnopus androsaceus JB14 TaxID=1447944 RepID=A0A6A4HJ90_9AGAR|nr:hypothetical protein BT96DRAFT_87831 [Gymnopus androsaceus JB14]